jgi:hypothetical protein
MFLSFSISRSAYIMTKMWDVELQEINKWALSFLSSPLFGFTHFLPYYIFNMDFADVLKILILNSLRFFPLSLDVIVMKPNIPTYTNS